MASIFTLTGVDAPTEKPKRKRKPRKPAGDVSIGHCKDVYNKRTKKTIAPTT